MGKRKKRKKRRAPKIPPVSACDRHHICFQKRFWNKGYAKAICEAFVRYVPIIYHRELHSILNSVPVPPDDLLKKAWIAYIAKKDVIDGYDVCRAIAWLYVNIPDVEFRHAMQIELDFFISKLQDTR